MAVFCAVAEYGGAYGPYDADKTLVYNEVITNVGGAYDKCTGVFTAPVTGVYSLTFSYHAGGELRAFLSLFRNDELIVGSSDHQTCSDGADNGGNAAVLQLKKGDKVHVMMEKGSHVWAANHHTSFSGFLIRADW